MKVPGLKRTNSYRHKMASLTVTSQLSQPLPMAFYDVKHTFFFAYLCLTCANFSLQNTTEGIETIADNFTLSKTEDDLTSTTIVAASEDKSTDSYSDLKEEHSKSSETTHLQTTTKENHNIDEVLESDEHPWWFKDALKDIAHYLRAHKFNEYDRRYNRNGTNVERTNFLHFPKPPLRSLHWEVHRYCEPSFLHCVDYLRKKLKHVGLRRQDDTSVVAQENDWGANSTKMISQIDLECRRMRKLDDEIAEPFEGPLERYQWRATASYFMCWYTMNEVPDLKHLGEKCDNFAYCLDMSTGPNNEDLRANDSEPFACAQYSFCPDPCCPNKHLPIKEFCLNDEKNPCHHENPIGQRECGFNRMQNRDFGDMILNRWNVTCKCAQAGYEWSSMYGVCVDVDECASTDSHGCTLEGQACLNQPGSFTCVCKWGYSYSEKQQKCIISEAVAQIKLNSKPKENEQNIKNKWKIIMRAMLKIIGKSSSTVTNKITCVSIVLGLSFFTMLL